MQTLGTDHQPVQSHEGQALRLHDVAMLTPLRRAELSGRLRQGEWSDLDAGVSGLADGAAGVRERPFVKGLVADGVAELIRHFGSHRGARTHACRVETSLDTFPGKLLVYDEQMRPLDPTASPRV